MNAVRIRLVVIASAMAIASSCGPEEEEESEDVPQLELAQACLDFCGEISRCEGATPPQNYCFGDCWMDVDLDEPTPCDEARFDLRICEGTLGCSEILLYQAGEPNPCSSQAEAEAAACE